MLNIRGLWLSILPFIALAHPQPIDFSAGTKRTASQFLIGGKLQQLSASFATQNDTDPFKGVKYHSGYISIGHEKGQMFYWYFPRENGDSTTKMTEDTPLILWLNGGPEHFSMITALTENGPLIIQLDGTVNRNPNSWSTVADIVYIDQPLGTGFSPNGDPSNKVTNERVAAKNMREFLVHFIEKFPDLKNKRLFLAGESGAGHFIPALGYSLLMSPNKDLDFVGVAIGNGWVDAKSQFPAFADFAFEHEMVGEAGHHILKEAAKTCVQQLEDDRSVEKFGQCYSIFGGLLNKKNPFDIRLDCEVRPLCYNRKSVMKFIFRDDVQSALGFYNNMAENDSSLLNFMVSDSVAEFRTTVGVLLKAGKQILVYSGDQDFVCNWRGGEAWVNNIEWEKQDEFRSKPYSSWDVNGKPSGAMRKVDNLTFLRVFDAGHMVPMDQPEAALTMITSFMKNNFNDVDFTKASEKIDSYKENDQKGSSFLALS